MTQCVSVRKRQKAARSDAAEECVVLADLFEDDDDDLTVVRAPLGVRHESGVIPLVDDRGDAIVEEAPPSTLRTEQLENETSHVRAVADDEEEHEPIGAHAFSDGTVVMDVIPPTPAEKLGKKTLQVTREEIFGNSARVDWRNEPPPALTPSEPPSPAEVFVDEVSQGHLTPLPIPAESLQPTIGELTAPASPPPPVLVPAPVPSSGLAGGPSSGRLRRRAANLRARVAAVVCVVAAAATAAVMAWQGWL